MFDFEFTTVRSYDGTNRTERAIKVFNTATGTTVTFCRRRPFENREAWVARAMEQARRAVW